MKFGLIWVKFSLKATAQNVRIEEGTCNTTLNQNQSTVSLYFTKADEPFEGISQLSFIAKLPLWCNEKCQWTFPKRIWSLSLGSQNEREKYMEFSAWPKEEKELGFLNVALGGQSFSLFTCDS